MGDDLRVVIIDKFPSYIDSYISFFQHLVVHGCNPHEYTFVSRLAKDRLFVEIGQKDYPIIMDGYDKPLVSRNGNLMMYIGGFKNAVEKQGEEIRRFLVA